MLGNAAERCSLSLLNLNGCRVGIVQEIEEFEKALDFEALADDPRFRDAQIHVHEWRGAEGIATGFQIAAVKRAITVQVYRCDCGRGIAEAALRPEQAAELNFPGQFHEAVELESVTESEIGRAAIDLGSIVESALPGNERSVTGCKSTCGVCLTGTDNF